MIIDKQAEYTPAPKKPDYKTLSLPGTSLLGGFVTLKEKNPQLMGRLKYELYDEMLQTDTSIARSFSLLKNTLLSATFKFVPAHQDDEESLTLCKYMNQAFGLAGETSYLQDSFENILEQVCLFIPYGFQYFEECLYNLDGKVWLKTLAHCEQTAHWRWLSSNGRDLDGVQQLSMVGGVPSSEPIPSNKLLLFTLNKSGANFEGIGLLRPCYFWWREKQNVANLASIGLSRWAAPTPLIQIDRSAIESQGFSDEEVDTMLTNAAMQASAYASLEASYLIENPVVKFATYGGSSSGFDAGQVKDYLNEIDNQLASAWMSNFMNLGISSTGSRSVGEVHSEVFKLACINLLEYICSVFNGKDRPAGGVVGRLIKYNFGDVPVIKYPRLVATGLDTDELSKNMFNLPALIQSGLLEIDSTLLDGIREKLGLPPVKQEQNQPQQPIVGGTPNE